MQFKFITRIIFIFGFILLVTYVETEDVIVQIPNGKIRGLILQTRKGRDVFTFYGIRYGEPPIGKNRFKPPIAAQKWNGVYNATVKGQACMQSLPLKILTLSEDCLLLDVYSADLNASKPVILFIPGGAFMAGSKYTASFEYLLDKEVVLVAINYRIDAFGFFSMGRRHASGNQGLKDQNLAMRWVRDNIKYFGGNPDLITLSGHSSGSMCVTLHMLSSMSYGLFHRAIAMSGSAVGHVESYARNASKAILEQTNCNNNDVAVAVECLQKVPADKILKASLSLLDDLLIPWFFDIESEDDEQPFITENPVDLARKGYIQPVPLMTGITYDELHCITDYFLRPKPHMRSYLKHYHTKVFPKTLFYRSNPNRTVISHQIFAYYIESRPRLRKHDRQLINLVSDGFVAHGVHRMVEYARQVTNVYYYRIDYHGRYSQCYDGHGKPLGVLHADDLQYVLVFPQTAPVFSVDDPENPTIERMTSWWSKFAETGDPNDPSNNWTNTLHWTPCTRSAVKNLYVNEICKVSSEPYPHRYDLWDSLFPLY